MEMALPKVKPEAPPQQQHLSGVPVLKHRTSAVAVAEQAVLMQGMQRAVR